MNAHAIEFCTALLIVAHYARGDSNVTALSNAASKDLADIEKSIERAEHDVIDIEQHLNRRQATAIGLLLALVALSCVWRCCKCLCQCCSRRSGYSQVSHSLDDEEQSFKQTIELAEVDELFTFDDMDTTLDEDELEQMQMFDAPATDLADVEDAAGGGAAEEPDSLKSEVERYLDS